MGSTFGSYSIATSGLYNGQAALTTVSTNLSNVNTTGYSRQRVISTEDTVVLSGDNSYGAGVDVESIERVRNSFLDKTYRAANSRNEYFDAKDAILEDAQSLLNEYEATDSSDSSSNGDNGLQQTIQDFFDAWDDLAADPSSQSSRSALVESAVAMVDTLTSINDELSEMQEDAKDHIATGVDTLNSLAQQVSALNVQIIQASASGGSVNDLQDQRDALIDQMSGLTNINVLEQSDGSANVYIGGVAFVQGENTHTLEMQTDVAGNVTIHWQGLNDEADITDGSIKAYLEEVDQSSVTAIADTSTYDYSTEGESYLSTLRQGLNNLLTTITSQVNTLLETGIDLEGNTGVALFTTVDSNKAYAIGNIQVNPEVSEDVDRLATGTTGGTDDNTLALAVNDLQSSEMFTTDGSNLDFGDFYQALVSWVSTTGDTIDSNYDTQTTLLEQADSQRTSVAGVSQDEELSKMITYQSAYNASARVLNVVDALIGEMIEDLGS